MADETQTVDTVETEAPEVEAQETQENTDTGTTITDVDALQKELDKARRDAARYRTERNDLKGNAEKWAEFEESQKSEIEKVAERNAALEAELTQVRAAQVRAEVIAQYGLTADDDLLLGDGDRDELVARAEKIAELRKKAAEAAVPPPSGAPRESLKGGAGDVDEPVDDAFPAGWIM